MNKELKFLVDCLKQNPKYQWLDFVMGYDFANDYWNIFIDDCYEKAKDIPTFSVRGIQSRTLLFSKTPLFEFSVNLITLTFLVSVYLFPAFYSAAFTNLDFFSVFVSGAYFFNKANTLEPNK
jgi:hypothetical protein